MGARGIAHAFPDLLEAVYVVLFRCRFIVFMLVMKFKRTYRYRTVSLKLHNFVHLPSVNYDALGKASKAIWLPFHPSRIVLPRSMILRIAPALSPSLLLMKKIITSITYSSTDGTPSFLWPKMPICSAASSRHLKGEICSPYRRNCQHGVSDLDTFLYWRIVL